MFTDQQLTYLRAQGLARIATVDVSGQPDVVPVAFEYDGTYFWVGGSGLSVTRTRKFQNVMAGHHRVAIVVDDVVSLDPFIARGIRTYGRAEGPIERAGMVGPGYFLRISPVESWAWNMAGEPVGEEWYPAVHIHHEASL